MNDSPQSFTSLCNNNNNNDVISIALFHVKHAQLRWTIQMKKNRQKTTKPKNKQKQNKTPHTNTSWTFDVRTKNECVCQSLELLMQKERTFLGGDPGTCPPPPPPRKMLKFETKICAIWAILEAYLKKCSTLKSMMNISFVPSICIHRSIILNFI